MNCFQYKNNTLYAEDIALMHIARTVKTPFYVYSASVLRHNFHRFKKAFSGIDTLVAYAVKANSNQAVLTILAKEGAGAEVVSEGEMRRALAVGIKAENIVFSGIGKTMDELDFALTTKIRLFNVESESELVKLSQRAVANAVKASVSLRINPDIDAGTHEKISTGKAENKFGIPLVKVHDVYKLASTLPGIRICGIDVHIGSQICSLFPFEQSFSITAKLVEELRQAGHEIHHVDIGGGLGISYCPDIFPPSLEEYATLAKKNFKNLNVHLVAEPGRFIAGNAGLLVASILYIKKGDVKNFVIIDAAMNDLLRPALYDAWHNVMPVMKVEKNTKTILADIVGPVCETADSLASNRMIPFLKDNALLAFADAGAYGAVMSNTYNTRLLIPEILVEGSRYHIIRPRPSYAEIIAMDKIPSWL